MLRNGPFWMLAGAVLVLFFLPLGPFWSGTFWFQWYHWKLVWNSLPDSLRNPAIGGNSFRQSLKTILFATY